MNTFRPFILIALLASSAYAQFTIFSLQNVVVCRPSLISWSGGTGMLLLVLTFCILPAGQPSAQPLLDLGKQDGTSVTWTVNLAVGTSAFLNLRDSTGQLGQSGDFTILAGSDTSCVGQPITTQPGSGGGSPQTSPTSSGSTNTATKSGSTNTPSPSPSKAAATSQHNHVGAAAMIGAIVLAIAA